MKNLLILLLILSNINSFCQESEVFTARQVTKMTVLPGCEKFTSNKDLQSCLSTKITKQLAKALEPHTEDYLSFRMDELSSVIQFIIDKKGKIIKVSLTKGNAYLGEKTIEALENYGKDLTFEPAFGKNNEPVNLIFQIPIKFNFFDIWNKELSIFEDLQAREIVYLTIREKDETYEIRLKKDLTFSVYSLKNNQEEFLGNVPNWLEFQNMEPFAKYLNAYIDEQQWELMTEGNLNGETYRIYRWSYDLEYVRVYQLVNGEEELVLKSNRFSKFKKSPYLKLLFRQ